MLPQSFAKTSEVEPWQILNPPYFGERHERVRLKLSEGIIFVAAVVVVVFCCIFCC